MLLAVAATFAAVVFGLPIGSRSATGCDVEVGSRDALTSAVQSTANAGKTICATAGSYGSSQLVWTVDQPAMTRVLAQPADGSVSIPGSVFVGASNLTVEGFNVTSGSSVESNASHIKLVNNRFHDMSSDVLDLHEGNTDVWFVGNLVQNIRYTAPAIRTPSSSAGSTRAHGSRARAPRPTAVSAPARTPSACAPPTRPGTPIRRRQCRRGGSADTAGGAARQRDH